MITRDSGCDMPEISVRLPKPVAVVRGHGHSELTES